MLQLTDLSLLALVGVVSLCCQWVAWRMRLPAILPLLVSGVLLGPLSGILDPDTLFGELLFPLVALSVAIILFEGALTLDLREIRGHGRMVRNLISIGMVVTWAVIAAATHWFMALSWSMSALFAALVVVTGPTVIVPLLRAARPQSNLANILRWEGILIDPVGALLAVLVYEFVVSSQDVAMQHAAKAFVVTVALGFALGWIAARVTESALLNKWMPHYLRNPAMLCFMLGIFALSNQIQHESGLLTVTVMGMILGNRHHLDMESIHEFKETLSVLLISALFILLAARIELSQIVALGWPVAGLMAVIVLVARPICVWLSALGTNLSLREQALLAWISPRGIVAAAISGLFALKLEAQGMTEAALLTPLVFLVIVTTVVLQSLTASPLTRWLKLQAREADGVLIFGANQGARTIARALHANGVSVRLADTNWDNLRLARMDGLPIYFGNPSSEHARLHLDLEEMGQLVLISPYRHLNPLVAFHFQDWFGAGRVTAVDSDDDNGGQRRNHGSVRVASLNPELSYAKLSSSLKGGAEVKTTRISPAFTLEQYKQTYKGRVIPLFTLDQQGRCRSWAASAGRRLGDEWQVISLVLPAPIAAESSVGV